MILMLTPANANVQKHIVVVVVCVCILEIGVMQRVCGADGVLRPLGARWKVVVWQTE